MTCWLASFNPTSYYRKTFVCCCLATSALLETHIGGQIRCALTKFGIASVISWHKG
ncbi:hypothetical protein GGR67_003533 [Xanthomonas arboricola]|nr:hypothetical protein [Xanthomonas cannabis]MBB5769429.1 hypothetical protein [Xanthomonas euroxanthea]